VIDGSGGLTIGDDCDISCGAQIYTHSTVNRALGDRSVPVDRAPTILGSHIHVGANAVVLMGCVIGDYVVIGAGAVVKQFTVVPPHSLVVGVPATIRPLNR
jgi:acetyltransferase-like isoleucine patch superfamily enzyme